MEDRVQKLLILAGDQGAHLQSRDFNRIKQIIIDEYLSKCSEEDTKKIIDVISTVIMKISCKQHIYAGITAAISQVNTMHSHHIIEKSIENLQSSLNSLRFYESINVLNFLSELMNISLLNSLSFLNILEDIIDFAESQVNSNNKLTQKFLASVIVKSLPVCINSLGSKLPSEQKMVLSKMQALTDSTCQVFASIQSTVKKGNSNKIFKQFQWIHRLEHEFEGIVQYNTKHKLKIQIQPTTNVQWKPVQYFNLMNKDNQQELYKQFVEQEGLLHLSIIEQLIEQFYSKNLILLMKIQCYLASVPDHKILFLYKMVINSLIAKSLKSSRPIVEQSLLLSLMHGHTQTIQEEEKDTIKLTKTDFVKMIENALFELFDKSENIDFTSIVNISDLISFFFNGWKSDQWEWQRYIENANSEKFVKREVLMLLILEKIKALNDKFVTPKCISENSQYEPAQVLKNQQQYKTTEEMQAFQIFDSALTSKKQADVVKELIKSQKDYEYFLQALFRRTSLSQTHLKILIQRYTQILQEFKEYDWTLINKVRNFWKKSYSIRQNYLQLLIKKQFTTFNSYAKYIGKLENKSDKEMIWIKVELNQLNNLFGKK